MHEMSCGTLDEDMQVIISLYKIAQGLPKCGPCERTGSVCEYYDKEQDRIRNRNYILYLQDKVLALTDELKTAARKNLSASKETENQDMDEAELVPSTAAGKASIFVATSEQLQLNK